MLDIRIHNANDTAILACQGRLVLGRATETLESATQSVSARMLVLDLAGVEGIDAAGLGMLIRIKQRAEGAGKRLRLLNPCPLVQEMLALTRLDKVLEVCSDAPAVRLRRWSEFVGHLRPCDACV
jgi:anti-anti-sigma factor